MQDKLDFYLQLVEQAWELSDKARKYMHDNGLGTSNIEVFENVFLPSDIVDVEKTQEHSPAFSKIFLKSPYGLIYRPEFRDWIPFRHGPVDF